MATSWGFESPHRHHGHIIRTFFRLETGSDYWFSLRNLRPPTFETDWSGRRPLNREGQEKRNRQDRADASCDDCVRPDCLLFLFGLPLAFPFFKFPLPLYALVESENVGQDTAGDGLNLMLGNVGVVDWFLSLAQAVSSVLKTPKARPCVLSWYIKSYPQGLRIGCPPLCRKIMYRNNEDRLFSHSSVDIVSDFGCPVKANAGRKSKGAKCLCRREFKR